MKRVAILGCGPAGLMAAFGVKQMGHVPLIYSLKEKSVIPGSVYLHESVPGLTGVYPDNHVQYVRLGTEEGYAQKVYGDAARTTGWENYFQVYPSWNAVDAYDKLWDLYEDEINHVKVDGHILPDIIRSHDHVINTLPSPPLCGRGHTFKGADYWIKTLPLPPLDAHRDVVVYNGLATDLWYRWSVLSGVCSIESVVDLWPNDPGVKRGIKATSTDCDCWLWKNVTRAGRWAEWRHGVLLTDAYKTAREAARNL